MSRKIVDGQVLSTKDKNGIYLPSTIISKPKEIETTDISIDVLLNRGLRAIYGVMRAVETDIGTGVPSRETIMNLKDIMTMLKELKKEEKEFLDSLTDDQLKELKYGSSK